MQKYIGANRISLMGGAILMVLLYHLYCWTIPNKFLLLFRYWYIGVDIFFLLSAYGLCHSYNNHSLAKFYSRRVVRIIPLYWVQVIFVNTIALILPISWMDYHAVGLEDIPDRIAGFFCELTILSYLGVAGNYFNWYVSALLLFYLIFPFLYYVCNKYPLAIFLIASLLSFFYLHHYNDTAWYYDCLIARIPAFLLGICLYTDGRNWRRYLVMSLVFFCFSISYDNSIFLMACFFMPIVLSVLERCRVIECSSKQLQKAIACCGKYSYELFISNEFTAITLDILKFEKSYLYENIFLCISLYLIVTIIYSIIFIELNKMLQTLMIRKK